MPKGGVAMRAAASERKQAVENRAESAENTS